MTIESNDAIKAIAGMSAPQIILEWERVHGIRAPAIAPSLLARDLAHRVQVEAAGGIADNYLSYYALENQTRPTYDRSLIGWRGFPPTVAHELAHQWYGDSVAVEGARQRHLATRRREVREGLAASPAPSSPT